MKVYVGITLLFVLFYCMEPTCCFFGAPNFMRIRKLVEDYKKHEMIKQLKIQFFHSPKLFMRKPIVDQYFEQPLDHFDPENKGTYKQRYWVNDAYWNGSTGPVFLYIGGEGALSSLVVKSGESVDLGKKYGALLVAVEHRYYGASINDDGLELENMKYLSSQQALADLASIHAFLAKEFNLTSNNPWICFGGSYPGALSAWFRLKYPHLVYGAVASSAPVQAQTNFQGYNDVVAASLSDPVVNGSKTCAMNIQTAFQQVDALIRDKQYHQLEKDFLSCAPLQSDYDVYQFVSNLAGNFMGVVQYNNIKQGINIDEICKRMTSGSDPYANLITVNQDLINTTHENCSDNSWKNFIQQMMNTTVQKETEGAGLRQWLYQTCTQFGYYQTCDKGTSCIFSHYMSLEPNLDICTLVYNITPDIVKRQVEFSNSYYGSNQPKGSRIIFVNGSIDPWHALSLLKDASSSEIAVFINGTAHCANMEPHQPDDPPALRNARYEISARIGHWLQEAGNEAAGRIK